jgi:hypothetical protein
MPSLSSPALSRPYLIQSAVGLCVMMSLHLDGPDHQCLLNIHAGGYSDPQKDSIRKIKGVRIITVETYVETPTKTIEKLGRARRRKQNQSCSVASQLEQGCE